jgi:streptogramin lyase
MTGALVGKVDVRLPEKRPAVDGLAWDGESLWLTDLPNHKIHAVNPTTGQLIKTLNVPDVPPHGVAVGDGCLWVSGSGGTGANDRWKVLKMDPLSGAVLSSWAIPAGMTMAGGLEYCNGVLWVTDEYTKMWKLNPADGSVLGSFEVRLPEGASRRIQDLAKSGVAGQMWVISQYHAYLVEMGE